MERVGGMDTDKRIDRRDKAECAFEWGTCRMMTPTFAKEHVFHLCSGELDHTGLHVCGDCGVVYIKRRE